MTRKGTSIDLGAALGRLVRRLDRGGGRYRSLRLAEAWTEIAGPQIAGHTGRVFLRGQELVVAVDSPVWASELQAMSEMLRTRLNEFLGKEEVRTVRFSVTREVAGERERSVQESVSEHDAGALVTPRALSVDERRAVEESVAEIQNPALREAAFRATVRRLEWSKGARANRESPEREKAR